MFLLAVFNSQLNALIIPSGNSAFETADSIMGATNLIHMFARFVGAHVYLPILIILVHTIYTLRVFVRAGIQGPWYALLHTKEWEQIYHVEATRSISALLVTISRIKYRLKLNWLSLNWLDMVTLKSLTTGVCCPWVVDWTNSDCWFLGKKEKLETEPTADVQQ